jgi:hypothetical protein
MAEKTNKRPGNVMTDPIKIRAKMAKTRATLARELGALKGRVFGTPALQGEKTMSQAKVKSARSAKKAKKSARSPASTKEKAKEVLEHKLAGAALGAVKGAAEVMVPEKNGTDKDKKASQ